MKSIIFVLLFCSCAYYQNPELKTYIKDFVNEAEKHNCKIADKKLSELSADFIEIDGQGSDDIEIVGLCLLEAISVFIEKEYWETASDGNKELIMFHELGHCLLSKDDIEEEFPKHIMADKNLRELVDSYSQNKDLYLEELFKDCEE